MSSRLAVFCIEREKKIKPLQMRWSRKEKIMSIVAAVGNLATDPHISRNENNEATYARFTLVEDQYSRGKKQVTYIDCVGFGRMAEIIEEILRKGSLCYIEGSMVSGQYTKNDRKIYTRNVRVNRLRVLNHPDRTNPATGYDDMEENLPFDEDGYSDDDLTYLD